MTFTVPGDPAPWERARGNGKRRFTSPRARAMEKRIRLAALIAGLRPVGGPVELCVSAYRASWHRCDWDNLGKVVSDALNGIAYVDDSQVCDAHVTKRVDPDRPRLEVVVIELEDPALRGFALSLAPRSSRTRLASSVRRFDE